MQFILVCCCSASNEARVLGSMLINDVSSQDLSNVSSVVSSSVFKVKEATHEAPITTPSQKELNAL